MPRSTLPIGPNYLGKRLAKEYGAKSLEELAERVKKAREAAADVLSNKRIASELTTCHYCRKTIAKIKDNIRFDKKLNQEVMACSICYCNSSRRYQYRKRYGLA